MKRLVGVFLFSMVFFWAVTSNAQMTTGTISGTVSDSTGAVLPGAEVVLLNEDTGIVRTTQADEGGRYSAPSLSLGNYRVTATLAGFQTEIRSGIVLTVGRQAIVNFELPDFPNCQPGTSIQPSKTAPITPPRFTTSRT